MMGKDHNAMEPLNPKPYSGPSPMITNQQQFSPQQAYNPQPTPMAPPQHVLYGPSNQMATCPYCKASVKTAIEYSVTTRTHRTAIACCPFCCVCLPYCLNSARNVDHYCPNCKIYLGTYER